MTRALAPDTESPRRTLRSVLTLCCAGALGCSGSIRHAENRPEQGIVAEGGGGGSSAGAAGVAAAGAGARAGQSGAAGALGAGRAGQAAPATGGAGSSGSGGAKAAAGSGGAGGAAMSGELVNPAPGSAFFMGVNFWNLSWEGSENYFTSDVSWDSVDNPWNEQFLKDLAPYHVLRFMDWNLINESDNAQAKWDTRMRPDATQDELVAFEWQIDLCNRSQKDYWVNIPHEADADYAVELANLIHDKLEPTLRVYVEWSNEVWNGSFPQRAYAEEQGAALGLNGDDKAAAYLVHQSVRAFEAFESVFGEDSPRVVKVLAGQAAWVGPCEAHLKALEDAEINPRGTKASVYAVAPYFYGGSVSELRDGIAETAGWVADNVECAESAGLPLIGYEGGTDSYSLGESGCAELQRESGMRELYTEILEALSGAKMQGPFMHYTHSGNCWGLKQKTSDAADDAPKYQGMLDWLSEQ
jgi:hypothetical protein